MMASGGVKSLNMIMAVSARYLSNSTEEAYGAHQEHSFYAVD